MLRSIELNEGLMIGEPEIKPELPPVYAIGEFLLCGELNAHPFQNS